MAPIHHENIQRPEYRPRLNMKFPVIVVATLIAVVTLIANYGGGNSILRFVQFLPGKDLAGHFGLYGALGFALSFCFRGTHQRDGLLVMLVALAIVLEEFSQMFFSHRTFSLADLAASLTGFTCGIFIRPLAFAMFAGRQSRQNRHQ